MSGTFSKNPEEPSPGLEEFSEEFLINRFKEIQHLKVFLKKNDLESIRQIAHKWKGYCRPYGFGGLETISIQLEDSAKCGSIKKCEDQIILATNYLNKKAKQLRAS